MKMPLHRLVVAVSSAALLLLVVLFVFQEMSRRSIVKSTRFTEQYIGVIQQLRKTSDSVNKKMKRNEVMIPDLVVEAALEVPSVTEAVSVTDSVPVVVAEDPALVLQGISWNEGNPLVMIQGRLYKPGDKIGGVVIQKISPQAVVLRGADGVQREITLFREE